VRFRAAQTAQLPDEIDRCTAILTIKSENDEISDIERPKDGFNQIGWNVF
jgi:hypothetical protein